LVYNHLPYGFVALDGALVRDAVEQAVITRMGVLREQGVSYNEIANTLNGDGVATKQGGLCIWHSQSVKNTLEAAA
jgi:hypothetical protein